MEEHRFDSSDEDNHFSHLRAVSSLSREAWGVAALLAIAPAVGLYLLLTQIAPYPQPSFMFFYWIGALYASARKASTLIQAIKRIGVMAGLECLAYLFILLF